MPRWSDERARRVARGELVGLSVSILSSRNPTLVGVEGKVVDETRNTFVIEKSTGTLRRIPKRGQVFSFLTLEGERVVLKGSWIEYSPEDRLKKVR